MTAPEFVPLADALEGLMRERAEHIEMMAAAFVARAGADALEYQLIEQRSDDGRTTRWWFEHKDVIALREVAITAGEGPE